jgi:signal transduction histidine kinase
MRHRLAASFFALGAVCACIMIADRAHSTRTILVARLDARAETLASAAAEESAELLRRGEAGQVRGRMRSFERLNDVERIAVSDARGVLIHQTRPQADERAGAFQRGRAFIRDARGMLGSVEVTMSTASIGPAVESASLQGAPWAALCIGLLAWASWYLGALAGGKVERLIEAVDRIGHGESVELPDSTRSSEIGALSRAFADLRRKLGEEEGRRRKLEEQRDDMTNMLVHDMKHPLTVFRMVLVLLGEMMKTSLSKDMADAIAMANRSTYTLDAMIDGVLQTARLEHAGEPPPRTRVAITKFVKGCAEVDSAIVRSSGKAWSLWLDPRIEDHWILASGPVLRRLVGNLVLNAIEHSPDGSKVTLAAAPSAQEPSCVEISVSNDGSSLDCEPTTLLNGKYRSDGERSHAGLGLAFCRLAAHWHSGRMGARRSPDGTATFFVTLPMGRPEAAASSAREEAAVHETA